MGRQWLRSLVVVACTVQVRVIPAIPPLRSTVIFMASFLGFSGCREEDWPALPAVS
jgi:hypothetical protein